MTTTAVSPTIGRQAGTSKSTLRVLVAEKFEAVGVEGLKHLGCEVKQDTTLTADTLAATVAEFDPKVLIAELQTLAAELEELTRAVERNSPAHLEPGEYRIANG